MKQGNMKVEKQLGIIVKTRVAHGQILDLWEDDTSKAFDTTVGLITNKFGLNIPYEETIAKAKATDTLPEENCTAIKTMYEESEVDTLLTEMAQEPMENHEQGAIMTVVEYMKDYHSAL